jgi:hypothetical protein
MEAYDMRLPIAPLQLDKPRAVSVLAAVIGISLTAGLRAAVSEVTFKDLATRSDLIVVAQVSKIEDGPPQQERSDPRIPALKIATVQVIETLKGAYLREIRYVASPSWS